jgi:hypothetical protein
MTRNNNINSLFKPMSNEKMLLGIVGTIMAMVPIILMINNYAYENGKLVCDNYVLNSYLYALLGFCLIALGAIFENKVQLIPKLLGNGSWIIRIIGFIVIIGIFAMFSYIIKSTNPNNFITIHMAYFFACALFGMLLSLSLLLGYATGVLYQAIGITIGLTALMAFVGYKYGHLFITIDFDKWLRYALFALIIWTFIAQYLINDFSTLLLAVSIPSAIIFCLLLMSYNNQLRKNQSTCKVPNYPDEALGLVVKIGNLLADVIRILMALKGKKGRK